MFIVLVGNGLGRLTIHMPVYTVQVEDAVAQTIRETAKRCGITEQEITAQILDD